MKLSEREQLDKLNIVFSTVYAACIVVEAFHPNPEQYSEYTEEAKKLRDYTKSKDAKMEKAIEMMEKSIGILESVKEHLAEIESNMEPGGIVRQSDEAIAFVKEGESIINSRRSIDD